MSTDSHMDFEPEWVSSFFFPSLVSLQVNIQTIPNLSQPFLVYNSMLGCKNGGHVGRGKK